MQLLIELVVAYMFQNNLLSNMKLHKIHAKHSLAALFYPSYHIMKEIRYIKEGKNEKQDVGYSFVKLTKLNLRNFYMA